MSGERFSPEQEPAQAEPESSGVMGSTKRAIGKRGVLATAGLAAFLAGSHAEAASPLQQVQERRAAIGIAYSALGTDNTEILAMPAGRVIIGGKVEPESMRLWREQNDRSAVELLQQLEREKAASVHASEGAAVPASVLEDARRVLEADADNILFIEAGIHTDAMLDKENHKSENLDEMDSYGDMYSETTTGQKVADTIVLTRGMPITKDGKSYNDIKAEVAATKDQTLIATFAEATRKGLNWVLRLAYAMNERRHGRTLDLTQFENTPEAEKTPSQ